MMPQKLNPDVAELVRGKAGTAIGRLTGLLATVKGLPLAYNRDLQEDKPPVFAARADLRGALGALTVLVGGLELDRDRLAAAASDPLLLATDAAEALVREGVPFRDAHEQVAGSVRDGTFVAPEPASRVAPGPGAVREAVTPARDSGAPRAELPQQGARTLRVSLETLDRILDLTGEIAVDRGRLREALERGDGRRTGSGRDAPRVRPAARRAAGARDEGAHGADRPDLPPLRPHRARPGRRARQVGAARIEGEDVEVDAKVIEHVRDPLTHLVRNALSTASSRPTCAAPAARTPAACCGCARSARPAAS